jgi:hypothetical protein
MPSCIECKVLIGEGEMNFIGYGNTLSPSTSAYIVFKDRLPLKMFLGQSKEAFGTDMSGQMFEF